MDTNEEKYEKLYQVFLDKDSGKIKDFCLNNKVKFLKVFARENYIPFNSKNQFYKQLIICFNFKQSLGIIQKLAGK